MTFLLARFARLGARTTRRFSGGDASLGARTTRRFSGGDASLHRSAITQHLWALRAAAFAPPPPRADGSRVPAHSRVCVDYKLTSDAELRSRYESAFGTLRVGRQHRIQGPLPVLQPPPIAEPWGGIVHRGPRYLTVPWVAAGALALGMALARRRPRHHG